jgi:hypothetical protein
MQRTQRHQLQRQQAQTGADCGLILGRSAMWHARAAAVFSLAEALSPKRVTCRSSSFKHSCQHRTRAGCAHLANGWLFDACLCVMLS